MKFEENLGLTGKTRKKRAKKGAKKRKPATRRFYYKKNRKEGMEPTVETGTGPGTRKGGGVLGKLGEWGDFLAFGNPLSPGTNTTTQGNKPETPPATKKPLFLNPTAIQINTYIKSRKPNGKNGKTESPPYDVGTETILPQKNNVETVNNFFRMIMGLKNGNKEEWKRQPISTKDVYLPPEIQIDANGIEKVVPNKKPKIKTELSVMKNKKEVLNPVREVIKDPNDTLRDVIPGIMGEEKRTYLNTENIEMGGNENGKPVPAPELEIDSEIVEPQISQSETPVVIPQPEEITKQEEIKPAPVIRNNEPITPPETKPIIQDDDEELKLAILLATMDTNPPPVVVDIEPDTTPPEITPPNSPRPEKKSKDCDCEELTEQIKGILDDYFKEFQKKMKDKIPRPDDNSRYNNNLHYDDNAPYNHGTNTKQNNGTDNGTNTEQDNIVYDQDGNQIPIAKPYTAPAVYSTDYNNTVNYKKNDIELSTEPAHESKLVINNEMYKDKHVLPSYSSKNIVNITPVESKPQEHFKPPNNININIKEKG